MLVWRHSGVTTLPCSCFQYQPRTNGNHHSVWYFLWHDDTPSSILSIHVCLQEPTQANALRITWHTFLFYFSAIFSFFFSFVWLGVVFNVNKKVLFCIIQWFLWLWFEIRIYNISKCYVYKRSLMNEWMNEFYLFICLFISFLALIFCLNVFLKCFSPYFKTVTIIDSYYIQCIISHFSCQIVNES